MSKSLLPVIVPNNAYGAYLMVCIDSVLASEVDFTDIS